MVTPNNLAELLESTPLYTNEAMSRLGFLPDGPEEDLTVRLTVKSVAGNMRFFLFDNFEAANAFVAGWELNRGDDDLGLATDNEDGLGIAVIFEGESSEDEWTL